MRVEIQKVVLDVTNEETYRESLVELFDYDEAAATASFNKHYSFGVGVNIQEVVKDAMSTVSTHSFELHDLENKKILLVVAWAE